MRPALAQILVDARHQMASTACLILCGLILVTVVVIKAAAVAMAGALKLSEGCTVTVADGRNVFSAAGALSHFNQVSLIEFLVI